MRFFRLLRRHPLILLGGLAVAFVAWIWWDALPTREADPAGDAIPVNPKRRQLPAPPSDSAVGFEAFMPVTGEAVTKLSQLKPGMTRAEVESLVGPPAPDRVSPATVADGRVTYHTAYEADFGPPPTVRPIRPPSRVPAAPAADPAGRMLVTLEFDATKPGHPLVGIHYPDPLF